VGVVVPEEVLLVGLADVAAARGPLRLEVGDTGPADVPRVIHEVGGSALDPLHAGGQAADDPIPDPGVHTRVGRILTPVLGQDHGRRVRVVGLTLALGAVLDPSVALEPVRSRAAFPLRPPETTVLILLTG